MGRGRPAPAPGFGLPVDLFCSPGCARAKLVPQRLPTMIKLCDINTAAREKLPPGFSDKSGIGVHYTDAFIKPMNTTLPDGTRVSCKRKGLKALLTVGHQERRRPDASAASQQRPDCDAEFSAARRRQSRRG